MRPLPIFAVVSFFVGACDVASGARVHLTLPERAKADRVVVSGAVDDDFVFEDLEFPDAPRPLEAEESLVVLVDDALAGEDVVLTFVAKDKDKDIARAEASFDVATDRLVDIDADFSGNARGAGASGGDPIVVVIGEGEGEEIVAEGEGEGEGEGVAEGEGEGEGEGVAEGEGEGEGEGEEGHGHGHGHGHGDDDKE